jgi:hypothetical protein
MGVRAIPRARVIAPVNPAPWYGLTIRFRPSYLRECCRLAIEDHITPNPPT